MDDINNNNFFSDHQDFQSFSKAFQEKNQRRLQFIKNEFSDKFYYSIQNSKKYKNNKNNFNYLHNLKDLKHLKHLDPTDKLRVIQLSSKLLFRLKHAIQYIQLSNSLQNDYQLFEKYKDYILNDYSGNDYLSHHYQQCHHLSSLLIKQRVFTFHQVKDLIIQIIKQMYPNLIFGKQKNNQKDIHQISVKLTSLQNLFLYSSSIDQFYLSYSSDQDQEDPYQNLFDQDQEYLY